MSFKIRRKNAEVEAAVVQLPVMGKSRQTGFKKGISLGKLIPFYGNDPDRTNRNLPDFQSLVNAHKNGALRGPVRAVYDAENDIYYVVNGHRSIEASRDAGFKDIDVNVVYLNPGESATRVQEELFASDNQNRPYKGKAMLRTAIITNGKILMSKDVKRCWGIIQKYVTNQQDLDWLAANGAPDLVKIVESVVTYMVLARQKEDEHTTFQWQKGQFVTSMRIIKALEVQRETRDYVKDRILKPTRILERQLDDGQVPDCILSEAQKNRASKSKKEKRS